jgi:hypothetical protein
LHGKYNEVNNGSHLLPDPKFQKLWSLSMFQTIFLPHQHGRSALDTSRTLFLLASTQGASCRLVMNHLIYVYVLSHSPPIKNGPQTLEVSKIRGKNKKNFEKCWSSIINIFFSNRLVETSKLFVVFSIFTLYGISGFFHYCCWYIKWLRWKPSLFLQCLETGRIASFIEHYFVVAV